jgi:hypothetical protein
MTKEENELMHMADLLAYHHANFEFRVVDQCDGIDRALDEYKKHLTEFASAIVKYRKKRNLNYEMCGMMLAELAWIGLHALSDRRKQRKFIKACRNDEEDV